MIFDAIVLTGGRSSRLGGEAKAALTVEGRSLLARALDASAGARLTVVVGEATAVPAGVLVTREEPPFGGPAAAIAAGMLALAPDSDFTLVLACDMPHSATAVRELLSGAAALAGTDGVVAVDRDGHRQPLLGLYRTGPLAAAVRGLGAGVRNGSVRALLASLALVELPVPPGSTTDIDTWADAAGFGIAPPAATPPPHPPPPPPPPTKGQPMTERDDGARMAALAEWSTRLAAELGLTGLEVDVDAVLTLAGTAAHSVMRPAAPLTTYIVGYAAGLAAAQADAAEPSAAGPAAFERSAFARAAAAATALAESGAR
jgi:molybdopterin-guanine dinucleotide biosynthesis protein A